MLLPLRIALGWLSCYVSGWAFDNVNFIGASYFTNWMVNLLMSYSGLDGEPFNVLFWFDNLRVVAVAGLLLLLIMMIITD